MIDSDLDRLFNGLDEIEAPEHVPIPPSGQGTSHTPEPRKPASRRVVIVAVAFGVFGAAALFGWRTWERAHDRPPAVTPTPSNDAWAWAPRGWSELPLPPEVRDGGVVVWAGDRLIVWGGRPRGADHDRAEKDGFVFDPQTRTWSAIPPAPVAGEIGEFGRGVWTGSEILFVGVRVDGRATTLTFDPADETWSELPPSPHEPGWGGIIVWTGSELIMWGGGDQGSVTTRQGAALDPAAGAWRGIADAPIGLNLADATWTGSEMIVVGSEIDRGNHATTATAVALSYEPRTDGWRRLPDPPLSPQTSAVALASGRVVGWEAYSPSSAEYVPDENRWRSLETGDLEGGECYAEGVTVGDDLFTWDCGTPSAWFGETSAWARVGPPAPGLDAGFNYSFGTPYAAGSAVVVEHIETVDHDGTPYVGSPHAPMHLWLWRPTAPVLPEPPDKLDAEVIFGGFMWALEDDIAPYLPVYATGDALRALRDSSDPLGEFGAGRFRGWRTKGLYPEAAGEGRFHVDVDVTLLDGSHVSIVVELGPGTSADGRDARLVVTSVRITSG